MIGLSPFNSWPEYCRYVVRLDIILRTYDGASVHPRRFDKPKRDIVQRSVRSLCTAIKQVPVLRKGVFGYDIKLTIIDDHSSTDTLSYLRNEIAFMGDSANLIPLHHTGNNASMLSALQMARDSEADLVYVVEDDYLHQPDALTLGLEAWHDFQVKCPLEFTGISLVDCPTNYYLEERDGSRCLVVGGTDRPWRTIDHTGVCFLLPRGVIKKHWEAFDEIARYWPYLEERLTFNRLWNTDVGMFCPLVPLSYHLWENHPYYPVDELWEANQ